MALLQYFHPSVQQLFGLASVLITIFCFGCCGALIGGRKRFAAVDIFTGWGLVTGGLTIAGILATAPFSWLVYGFWALAVGAIFWIWRRDRFEGPEPGAFRLIWRILVLASPLLLLVTAMKASQWDEFSHWLPSAQYLFRFNGFPSSALPQSPAYFPAYPQAALMTTYLSSRLTGFFIENAGTLSNTIMLLCFAPIYLSVVARGLKLDTGWNSQWRYAAFGILGVTILSTVFVQKLVFTAYADTPTAITLAVLGILVWMILNDLENDNPSTRTLAWHFSLVSALFINLKQVNPVLLAILLMAAMLIAWRDPKIKVKSLFRLLPVMLIGPVIVFLSWRYHIGQHFAGGEFQFKPFDEWLVPQAFNIFSRMVLVLSKKGFYFAMMGGLSLYAVRSLFRYHGEFDRMAIITGSLFIGYNLFLFITYITAFDSYEGPRVASLWRYNTQLGLLGCTAAVYGLSILWSNVEIKPTARTLFSGLAIALVVGAPFVTAERLRFDIRPPKDHMRMVAKYLADELPARSRVAIINVRGTGIAWLIVRYEFTAVSENLKKLHGIWPFKVLEKSPDDIAKDVQNKNITHAWVHEVTEELNASMGLALAKYQSHLLKWTGTGWLVIKSWPYDGYKDPLSFPD